MREVTKACLDFAHELDFESVPPETCAKVGQYVFDLVCCAAAGSPLKDIDRIRGLFGDEGTNGEIAPLGSTVLVSAQDAGLINGAAGHILEMDDSDRTGLSHPGVMSIMPALIVGTLQHSSGRDFIAAVVAGYEVMLRIGTALGLNHYDVWHTTSTTGPFASVLAAGKLFGLTREELTHAFGNAGTLVCGLWEFNKTRAMSKILHVGIGISHGILAAKLARRGFTGADAILEGAQGVFKGFPSTDLDLSVFDDFGRFWRTNGVTFKPFPCCRHTHGGIDCGLAFAKDGIAPESIAAVKIETYRAAYQVVASTHCETSKDGKFSLPYTVLRALIDGKINEESFALEKIHDPAINALLEKVTVEVAPDIQSVHPHHEQCRVTLTLKDGKTVSHFVADALGEPENPMSEADLRAKGFDLLKDLASPAEFEKLVEMTSHLETIGDIGELYRLMHAISLGSKDKIA